MNCLRGEKYLNRSFCVEGEVGRGSVRYVTEGSSPSGGLKESGVKRVRFNIYSRRLSYLRREEVGQG